MSTIKFLNPCPWDIIPRPIAEVKVSHLLANNQQSLSHTTIRSSIIKPSNLPFNPPFPLFFEIGSHVLSLLSNMEGHRFGEDVAAEVSQRHTVTLPLWHQEKHALSFPLLFEKN